MLRIPYECVSASDSDPDCRAFMRANYPPTYMHTDWATQRESCPARSMFGKLDFFMMGTPCPPYSKMRHKRFANGSVSQHPQFYQTEDLIMWLKAFEPGAGCLEQVDGFRMGEDCSDMSSPLERQGHLTTVCCLLAAVLRHLLASDNTWNQETGV